MRKKQPKYASKRLQNVVQVREFVIRLPRLPARSPWLTVLAGLEGSLAVS
jgi:hypothetical protein